MRVAALYDIHANLPALLAVYAELDEVRPDLVVFGGDVVSGPQPDAAFAAVQSCPFPSLYVRGNGDRAPDPFDLERLSPGVLEELAAWPATVQVAIDGLGDVLFCHATPRSDTEIFTAITPAERVMVAFAGVHEPVVVCGHTHVRFDRRVGETRIVNAGAVGMPYEGVAGVAFWCLLGPDVEFRETAYHRSLFDDILTATGYPDPGHFDPETAEDATEFFEAQALR